MLQRMALTSFLSFKERTEFDFTPSKYGILDATNISSSKVLKGALFIGPNASGKTNALKGLQFLLNFINGDTRPLSEYSCILGRNKTVCVEYTFSFLGSTVNYNVSYIPREHTLTEILKVNNVDVLNRKGKQGSLLIGEQPIVDDQLDEQTSFLRTASFNTGRFPQHPVLHALMEYLLNSFYIGGYQRLNDVGRNAIKFAEKNGVEKLNQYLDDFHYDFTTEYASESRGMGIRVAVGSDGGKERKVLFLKRKGHPFPCDIYRESQGNQVFIDLLPNLIDVIEKPGMLIVDEFGNSLHNELAEEIIHFFMRRADQSQLFITSHSTNLISNSVFRPDQINLVVFDNENNHSEVWSSRVERLSHFKPREAQNLERMYLNGMFRGLPNYGEEVQN